MPNIFNDRYYKIIHGFQQPNGSFLLNNSVTEINNKLYGLAADNGSPNNYGKLYRCNFDGSEFEILYRFSGVTYGDGDQPVRNILYDNVSNKIYGVTAYGGVPVSPIYSVPTRGGGIIFSYDLTTDNYEVLYRFSGITVNNDGYSPLPTLIKVGNKLYGGTFGGGFSILPGGGGNGIIFEYDLTTNTYQVFYRLNANESEGVQVNGLTYNPNNNKIYGVAYIGGSSPGQGVLFEIDLLGNYTKLHDFSGTTYNDGDLPINELYIT